MTNIPRRLTLNKGGERPEVLSEEDVAILDGPLVILGEPGLGKSECAKALAARRGSECVSATVLLKTKDLAPLTSKGQSSLIIDGLDEASSRAQGSVVADVLGRLSELGNPPFVLACRAAEWLGAADHHQIRDFYGQPARTLHLEPFSREDALTFLAARHPNLDGETCLTNLSDRNLSDLWGNPLTLMLIGTVASQGEGLPTTKSGLLAAGAALLVREVNPGHLDASNVLIAPDDILDAAGSAFAALIMSSSVGIWSGPNHASPLGHLPHSEVGKLPNAGLLPQALRTRLFKPAGEGRHAPVHRVIAEFLGARWLAKRISEGAPERRVAQLLLSNGGVPSALRGLHAWLAHFSPLMASRVIKADPYGVLRYGEASELSDRSAGELIQSLADLADEDPYFRSEDWGGVATGLARPSLRTEIVALVTAPGRHFHLSSLLLSAVSGSTLTSEIAPDLLAIVRNHDAYYAERLRAAEALIAADVAVDWPELADDLSAQEGEDSQRLAIEIAAETIRRGFSASQIASYFLRYHGVVDPDDEDDHRRRTIGIGWSLADSIPPDLAGLVLDEITAVAAPVLKKSYWEAKHELATFARKLISKSLSQPMLPDPERFWSWARLLCETRHAREDADDVLRVLETNHDFRRAVQWAALHDSDMEDRPGMTLYSYLPGTRLGLTVNPEDAANFLQKLNRKDQVTPFDANLWFNLLRGLKGAGELADEVIAIALLGERRHALFGTAWKNLNTPPERDWEKEEAARQKRLARQRREKFARHRDKYRPLVGRMRTAEVIGALVGPAEAYLGRYYDMKNDADPETRVEEWLGSEIASAALDGFVAYLFGDQVLTTLQIVTAHSESKSWNTEAVMKAGASEMLRNGRSLTELRPEVCEAILASWWKFPEQNERRLGIDLGDALESVLFEDPVATEKFIRAVTEVQLAANVEHVSGLHRLETEPKFSSLAPRLAIQWLERFPALHTSTQASLLSIVLRGPHSRDLIALVRRKASFPQPMSDSDRLWASAAFLVDFERFEERLATIAEGEPDFLWSLRNRVAGDDFDRSRRHRLGPNQLAFVVSKFGKAWPPVSRPMSYSGRSNGWDASDFISRCINGLSADAGTVAAEKLEQLIVAGDEYSEQIKHARSAQRRLRRDTEYVAPSLAQIRDAVTDAVPTTIDDLKALVLDRLEIIKTIIRDAPTDGWKAYWHDPKPHAENICRDRLAEALEARLPPVFNVLPESLMPEEKRADLLVLGPNLALPIEIKGQWHRDVWEAHLTQLDEQYTRHYQAGGRGIYIVFWFGEVPRKNLPPHPDGLAKPATPSMLQEMIAARLGTSDRARIEVVVIDVSLGKSAALRVGTKPI